jgi:DNA helicase-2/ATP-dependent DNA helicase PcrA
MEPDMPASNRIELNEAQLRAVMHGSGNELRGPLLVIAGAGSGKTNTLAHRVAHLIGEGADPARMLLLTFSRRAAQELERRAGRVLAAKRKQHSSDSPTPFPWAGTFHGIGARILREYAERLGLAPNFTIHDRGDSEDLMAVVRQAHVADDATHTRFPGAATCLAIYSRVVNAELALTDVLNDRYPWCAAHSERLRVLFDAYVAAKQAQQTLDFDDLLIYWAAMMRVPAFAAEVGGLFDHVLVDEYQDTNTIQATIVRLLKPDGRGVTVVGDDAQAIYSFRAATVRNILDFPGQYVPPATVITLERNYRSTAAILDASNAVISLAKERYTKNLVTERGNGERPRLVTVADESAQAQFAADQVLAQRENGVSLREQAVLFRTSSHSAQLELELSRRNIPFVKFGGLRFLEAAHVKDLLSVLRWIENPRGRIAGFRALRLVPGVGPATASRWLDALDGATDSVSTMRDFKAPLSARDAWPSLIALYERLNASESAWPAEFEELVDWYTPHLERIYDDASMRLQDLAQLQNIAGTYSSREQFLTELTLDPPSATSAEAGPPLLDEDYLTLSTIHSAKGQEWKVVQVLNCIDGCMPSDMATGNAHDIEEERRLLYVAMTRARDVLSLLLPQRFYVHQQRAHGDRHVYATRSRFLTNEVFEHFSRETWYPRSALPNGDRAETTKVDLQALLRDVWAPRASPASK